MTISTTVSRRMAIMNLIENEKRVDVNELSEQFEISKVSIRKDLKYLENKNLLVRSRGGAFKKALTDVDLPVFQRRRQHVSSKEKIGKAATRLIISKETIYVDSGTTMMKLVKYIPKQTEITIITNAIDIILQLAEFPKIKVVVPGGILRRNSLSLVGEGAAEILKKFYVDKCFIGVDGIDLEKGLLTSNIEEANLSRICIKNSKEVIVLADSSKFNANGIMRIVPIDEINTIISDDKIPKDYIHQLEKNNIKVVIA